MRRSLTYLSAYVEAAAARDSIDRELCVGGSQKSGKCYENAFSHMQPYLAFCAIHLSASVVSLHHCTTALQCSNSSVPTVNKNMYNRINEPSR